MRSSDKRFLIRSFSVISVALCAFGAMSIALWDTLQGNLFLLGAILVCIALISAYLVSSYTLSSLFKTNRFLNILLKDTLHELNIPLSVINANLQMLEADEKDEKKIKRLGRIGLASEDLYALYKEVDYYIKKEIQEEVKETFFLDEVVSHVVNKHKEFAKEIAIEVNVEHSELYSDKHGLAKVISNLVHNALKYNQNHRPIAIFQKEHMLHIKDEGIGMSESELFLAFDRYYQADSSKEGYGIGLSLVKAYCDEFKIAMRINSQKGIGTEVMLDLTFLMNKR